MPFDCFVWEVRREEIGLILVSLVAGTGPRLRVPMPGWDSTHPPLHIYAMAAYIDTFMVYR